MTIPSQDLKTCSKCKEAKTLSDFYVRKSGKVLAECKECTRRRTRSRYEAKYEEIRSKDNASLVEMRKRVRDAAFAAYGGYKCVCCGETEPSFLTLDHINNDGAEFRRKIAGKRTAAGYHTYIWLAKNGYPEGIQVLCMNCNHGKRMNNGVCPHQVRCNDQSKDVGASVPKRTAPKLMLVSG